MDSKVKFKRGLEKDALNINEKATAEDGTLYLTTDTNSLYIGKEDGTLSTIASNNVYVGDTPPKLMRRGGLD